MGDVASDVDQICLERQKGRGTGQTTRLTNERNRIGMDENGGQEMKYERKKRSEI